MTAIRDIGSIAAKYAEVTPQRANQYADGVSNPIRDWKTSTAAANAAYKAGMTASLTEDRFVKAVNKSSTAIWQKGAVEKGTSRFAQGVALGQDKYAGKFAPFVNAIKSLVLPPRFARRDPRNLDRVKSVVDAMVATARSLSG